MSRRERPPYAWTPGIPLERRIPCGTSPPLNRRRRIRRIFCLWHKIPQTRFRIPSNAGSHAQGARSRRARCGPLAYWSTLASRHGAPFATSPVENAADEVPHPLKAGSDAQGAGRRCVLDVREPPGNAAHQVPRLTICGLALQDRGARISYAPRSSRKRAECGTSPC